MAEASDTNISGRTVAVGNHNVTHVYHGLPVSPEDLPPGARLVCHFEITTDPSAAAAATGAEQHVTSQHQQPRQQRQRTRGQPKQAKQQQPRQAEQQQPRQPEQQQPRQPEQHSVNGEPQQLNRDQQARQRPCQLPIQQQHPQSPIVNQPRVEPRSQTSPRQPVQVESSLPRMSEVQDHVIRTGDLQTSHEPAVTSRASYCGNPGSMLPYSLYPAMPLEPRPWDHPVQETGRNDGCVSVPLTLPTSDAHTNPKAMYSINPAECPPISDMTFPKEIEQLRILPKSIAISAKLEAFDTKLITEKEPSVISDIIVVTLASIPVLLVSDVSNRNIKIFHDVKRGGDGENVPLEHAPISLSPFKDGRVLVAYCNVCKFSIVNLATMTTQFSRQTSKVYSGIRCMDQSTLAACCHQTKSVDILDINGNILKSITSASFRKPSFLSVTSACIAVTDWESNTLSSFSREGCCKYVVSPSGKNSILSGVVQHGSKIYVADETGNRILSFEDSGKKVELVLSMSDGVERPRCLTVHNNTLFVGLVGGRVLTWKLPVVMGTRL